ncbi:hypothetical protein [Streptomyces sp. NBC_00091]|uniref:hypothetical protein n=1 Tax=Streptomyces sp. NBC_00091 TaxID=2975648 RepID=UPI00224D891D|nr:hypothetical protein [Streptomyces sp. NBC_00091]MCX5375011.1 hypothetical protein [Streptomyces sp. NBC_00091]
MSRLAVMAGAALLALSGTGSAQAAAPGWQDLTQPLPAGSSPLREAYALPFSASSATIVEAQTPCPIGGCGADTLQWEWNGTSAVSKPKGPYQYERGAKMAGTGPDDLWFLTYSDEGFGTGLDHWDGTAWTSPAFPSYFQPSQLLGTAPGELLVAGYEYFNPGRPIVAKWSGGVWSQTFLPAPGGKRVKLRAIHQTGPNEIWVSGETETTSVTSEMYVARFNGTSWTQVTVPKLTGTSYYSQQIAGTSTDLWFTGMKTDVDKCWTSLRYNGSAFTTVRTCDGTSIHTVVKHNGTWIADGGTTGLRKWTGTAWTPIAAPRTTGTGIRQLTPEPGGAAYWASGWDANGPFVARFTGTP